MLKTVLARLGTAVIKPELVFLALAIPFGIFSAIAVPQLKVSDENMHFLKAYNLASSQLGAHNCHYPKMVEQRAASIYQGNFDTDLAKVDFQDTVNATCGSAASYSPIMHMSQAVGIFIAKLIHPSTGVMILLGRLANLAFFVAAVYYIIKKVRIGKWVFAVIALFPLSIHMAASLSSDAMNNVIVMAFIAFVFNLFIQKKQATNRELIVLAVLSGALALTKATNIVLLFMLPFLPANLFGKSRFAGLFNAKKWTVVAICAAFSTLCLVGWQKMYSGPLAATAGNILQNNPVYFLVILYNTYINPFLDYGSIVLRGIIGEFASFSYHLPLFMLLFCIILLLLALLHKNSAEEKNIQGVSATITAASLGALSLIILAVTYALYNIWATLPSRLGPNAIYADGVQGRYFLAALPLLVPFFIWLREYIRVSLQSEKMFSAVMACGCAFVLLFYAAETLLYLV